MSTNIEIEAKALINKEGYELLTKDLEKYKQINYYIDYSDLSLSKTFGLRIRFKNNKYELTLKTDLEEGKLETNQIISEEVFLNFKEKGLFPNGEVKNHLLLLGVNVNELKIFTTLLTYRSDVRINESLISIDKNEYNNIADYEVECESSSMIEAMNVLREYLNKNKVPFSWNKVTKLERAIKSL